MNKIFSKGDRVPHPPQTKNEDDAKHRMSIFVRRGGISKRGAREARGTEWSGSADGVASLNILEREA